jgi:peptidoglycan/LPS O-acetylase OafA/YrhL
VGLLRFTLAAAVVVGHTEAIFGLTSVGGEIAVEAFYMISGFYMSLVLHEKYIGPRRSYRLFITNRFLRLFPIYWSVALMVVALGIAQGLYTGGGRWGRLSPYFESGATMHWTSLALLAISNVIIFFQDAVLFVSSDEFLLLPQAWTISVELVFYLLAPFVVTRSVALLAGILAASVALRFALYRVGLDYDPWTYRFFPLELAFFMMGCLSYRMLGLIRERPVRTWLLNLFWALAVGGTVFFGQMSFPGKTLAYFLVVAAALPFVFLRTAALRCDAWIGELSYPLYLCHVMVLSVVASSSVARSVGTAAPVLVSSIAVAIVLYLAIGQPVERRRQFRVAAASGERVKP